MSLPTILVEDSAAIRASLIPALQEFADVEIIALAASAAEGIAALEAHAGVWRLAVIDIFLRGGNGLEVVRSLKNRSKGQRVVVLSNYATSDIRARALHAGADAVFDKSTELDEFFALCAAYAGEAD